MKASLKTARRCAVIQAPCVYCRMICDIQPACTMNRNYMPVAMERCPLIERWNHGFAGPAEERK